MFNAWGYAFKINIQVDNLCVFILLNSKLKNHSKPRTRFLCAMGFSSDLLLYACMLGPPFLGIPYISVLGEYKGGRKGLMISEQNEICVTYLLRIYACLKMK